MIVLQIPLTVVLKHLLVKFLFLRHHFQLLVPKEKQQLVNTIPVNLALMANHKNLPVQHRTVAKAVPMAKHLLIVKQLAHVHSVVLTPTHIFVLQFTKRTVWNSRPHS